MEKPIQLVLIILKIAKNRKFLHGMPKGNFKAVCHAVMAKGASINHVASNGEKRVCKIIILVYNSYKIKVTI